MLQNAKYIYALDMWTVEKRPTGWYFSKSAYQGDKHEWRGPYSSQFSVTLMQRWLLAYPVNADTHYM